MMAATAAEAQAVSLSGKSDSLALSYLIRSYQVRSVTQQTRGGGKFTASAGRDVWPGQVYALLCDGDVETIAGARFFFLSLRIYFLVSM